MARGGWFRQRSDLLSTQTMRRFLIGLAVLAGAVLVLLHVGYRNARADPVVRRAVFALPGWPAGQRPVSVVLLSDVHAGDLAVDTGRLTRVVAQVDALRPDLILIAGDFLTRHDPIDAATATAALAPLKGLHAPLGVLAVPGNHDHWTGLAAVRSALAAAQIPVFANQVVRRGPLVIGAVDDAFSGHAELPRVVAVLRRVPEPRLVLTHSPDIAAQLPPDVPLLLAGHTHCGQVVLPFFGSPADGRYYNPRYRCGIVRRGGQAIVVSGGIGGSLPLRLGAPPDLWLLTLRP